MGLQELHVHPVLWFPPPLNTLNSVCSTSSNCGKHLASTSSFGKPHIQCQKPNLKMLTHAGGGSVNTVHRWMWNLSALVHFFCPCVDNIPTASYFAIITYCRANSWNTVHNADFHFTERRQRHWKICRKDSQRWYQTWWIMSILKIEGLEKRRLRI